MQAQPAAEVIISIMLMIYFCAIAGDLFTTPSQLNSCRLLLEQQVPGAKLDLAVVVVVVATSAEPELNCNLANTDVVFMHAHTFVCIYV